MVRRDMTPTSGWQLQVERVAIERLAAGRGRLSDRVGVFEAGYRTAKHTGAGRLTLGDGDILRGSGAVQGPGGRHTRLPDQDQAMARGTQNDVVEMGGLQWGQHRPMRVRRCC